MSWFLELVSLLTSADEVRVPGGADDPVGTLLRVFLCVLCVSVLILFRRVLPHLSRGFELIHLSCSFAGTDLLSTM